MLFQKNHLIRISFVTANLTNDGFFLVVAIQAAEEAAIHIHDRHIMPPLGFVVDRNSFFPIQPPVILSIVVCGFDFQNCGRAIRKFYKVVHISQHPGILGVLEHLLDLINLVAGPMLKNFCHQRLQQMPHFQSNPVVFVVLNRCNIQLVVVEVTGRPPGRYPQQRSHITAANSFSPISEPFLFG